MSPGREDQVHISEGLLVDRVRSSTVRIVLFLKALFTGKKKNHSESRGTEDKDFLSEFLVTTLLFETTIVQLASVQIQFVGRLKDARVEWRSEHMFAAPLHSHDVIAGFGGIVPADDGAILQVLALHLHSKRTLGSTNFHSQLSGSYEKETNLPCQAPAVFSVSHLRLWFRRRNEIERWISHRVRYQDPKHVLYLDGERTLQSRVG